MNVGDVVRVTSGKLEGCFGKIEALLNNDDRIIRITHEPGYVAIESEADQKLFYLPKKCFRVIGELEIMAAALAGKEEDDSWFLNV
jgi:hypothetical protein